MKKFVKFIKDNAIEILPSSNAKFHGEKIRYFSYFLCCKIFTFQILTLLIQNI